jgi:hypothetical protein
MHEPALTVWYEILDPIRCFTVDGRDIADDYGNVAFTGTGRSRAHAANAGVRPDCIPPDAPTLPSHDLWVRPANAAIERCERCRRAYPLG